ncbi:MAG: DMT family transporter [Bacteroidota bacterium]
MNKTTRAYLEMHLAVLLFGFTAILGALIQLPAISIVWWRVLLTCISIVFLMQVRSIFTRLSYQQILQFMGIGVLVGSHWVCFYGSIKLANASVALICMATTALFTSFLEPLLFRRAVRWYEVVLGLMIIPGMYLIVDSLESGMLLGVWVGLLSAFLASLFATLNKKVITNARPFAITFLELGSAWLFLTLLFPFYLQTNENVAFVPPSLADWFYLLALALLCTTLAYSLSLRALHHISAFASNLSLNLEPVYGILLAWVLLNENEELSDNFYYGVLLILLTVFSYPLLRKWFMVGKE